MIIKRNHNFFLYNQSLYNYNSTFFQVSPPAKSKVCIICSHSFTIDSHSANLCSDCQIGGTKVRTKQTNPVQCICPKCKVSFENHQQLSQHVDECYRSAHPVVLHCPMCEKIYIVRKALSSHCRNEHNMDVSGTRLKPYKCEVCDKHFAFPANLLSHKSLHLIRKSYVCDVCKNSFRRKENLVIHYRKHTMQYKCEQCGKVFVTAKSLTQHFVMHHSIIKLYECDVCKRGYVTQQLLASHYKLHEAMSDQRYQCSQCQKCFGSSSHLKDHEAKHSDYHPYNCDV